MYAGGATENFDRDKIIVLVEDRFYSPSIKWDVVRVVSHCQVCQVANSVKQNIGPYTPLLFAVWVHPSMDFVLGFSRTLRKHDQC